MDPEADAVLQDLKTYLSSIPTLVAPKPQESLLLFLAATNQVVSAALVAQWEVDESAAATAITSREENEPVLERSDAVQDNEEQGSGGSSKITTRKKVV